MGWDEMDGAGDLVLPSRGNCRVVLAAHGSWAMAAWVQYMRFCVWVELRELENRDEEPQKAWIQTQTQAGSFDGRLSFSAWAAQDDARQVPWWCKKGRGPACGRLGRGNLGYGSRQTTRSLSPVFVQSHYSTRLGLSCHFTGQGWYLTTRAWRFGYIHPARAITGWEWGERCREKDREKRERASGLLHCDVHRVTRY